MLMLLCAVTTWAQLSTQQYYKIKNVTTGHYLKVSGDNTNLKFANDGASLLLLFQIEETGDGKYYIKSEKGETTYYIHASGWNFNATTNEDNKTPFTIDLVEGENAIYSMHQSTSTYAGYAGTDGTSLGESVYCNKSIDNNGKWAFEPVALPRECAFNTEKEYRIKSELSGLYMECVNFGQTSGEGAFQLKEKSANDGQKFKFVNVENENNKYYLQLTTGGTQYYVNAASWNFYAGTESTTPFTINLVEDENAIYSMHQSTSTFTGYAGNKDNGADASAGTKIYNNQPNLNGCTTWFFEEVVDEVVDITYIYMLDGEEFDRETVSAVVGAPYPEYKSLPFGVTPEAQDGVVTKSAEIAVVCEDTLPFEHYNSVDDIKTWYYAQMHYYTDKNYSYRWFIAPAKDGLSIRTQDHEFAVDEVDAHLWGFVGTIKEGFKMVNKATKQAIKSNNSGVAAMAEVANATAFIAMGSAVNAEWFCMKNPAGNYLNAQGSVANASNCDFVINHYEKNDGGSSFFLTEYVAENVTVEVSAAGWATKYFAESVHVPAGVDAYIITGVEDGWITKSQIEKGDVIPANTGVLLEGVEGKCAFGKTVSYNYTLAGNLLNGSVEDTYVEGTAYVLANGNKGVGFYKAELNKNAEGGEGTTHFKNNAGKAYLVLPAAENSAAYYGFDWAGTTGVEDVVVENEVKAIYDLTGRRVEAITAAGIYIINGKKTLVK